MRQVALGVITSAAAIWVLRTADVVFVPVVMAFVATAALRPLHRRLEALLPKWLHILAHLGATAALLVVLGLLGSLVAFAISRFVAHEESGPTRLLAYVEEVRVWAESQGIPFPSVGGTRDALMQAAQTVATEAVQAVGGMLVVVFLLLLLLDEARILDRLIQRAFGEHAGAARDIADESADAVRTFLVVRTVAGGIAGALGLGWMLLLGVELAWVWAILTFVLNYVPKLGSVFGAVPSVTLTLVTQGPARAALLGAGLLLIEQIVGNWIDPKLQGRRLALSPFAVLVSVLFFGWLWGIPGAFLAVPMLAFGVACAARVPGMQPVTVLLRGEEGLEREG